MKWLPPAYVVLKFISDGSWVEGTIDGAVAGVCRYLNGVVTDGFVKSGRASSVIEDETLALQQTLERVKILFDLHREGDLQVVVEGDNSSLVRYVMGSEQSPWAIRPWIEDRRFWRGQLRGRGVRLAHRLRDASQVVDWIVKAHRKKILLVVGLRTL